MKLGYTAIIKGFYIYELRDQKDDDFMSKFYGWKAVLPAWPNKNRPEDIIFKGKKSEVLKKIEEYWKKKK